MDTPSEGPETYPHERSIQPVEEYLERVRLFLPGFSLTEREKIIDEVRARILTQYQRDGELRRTLRRLGGPGATAALVIVYSQLAQGSKSWSPFKVARAAGHPNILGALGFLTGVIVLLGYGATTVCFGCSALILLFPWIVERWLGLSLTESSLNLGLPLAAAAIGILAYVSTTLLSHFLFQRLGVQTALPLGPPCQLVPWEQ
jgi:uncharacterized membrane protein